MDTGLKRKDARWLLIARWEGIVLRKPSTTYTDWLG
jgi:hypothetical protein